MAGHRKTPEQVLAHVKRGDPDECWEWQGYRAAGYGQIKYHGVKRTAHSLVRELSGWEPCEQVRHMCNNRACCNPRHLLAGDAKSNAKDRMQAGTGHCKEAHHKAKLNLDQVREIRRRYAQGETRRTNLASEFGVTRAMIGYIVRGDSWKPHPVAGLDRRPT